MLRDWPIETPNNIYQQGNQTIENLPRLFLKLMPLSNLFDAKRWPLPLQWIEGYRNMFKHTYLINFIYKYLILETKGNNNYNL